ncbi:MAG TPA: hypothetical protein PKN36_05350 [bacterium]|nr:hypothetical protein [bacterium]
MNYLKENNNCKKRVIIDFAGKAGVGKTYVKNKILEHICSCYNCIDLSDARIKAIDCFYFIWNAPGVLLASLALVFSNVPETYWGMFRALKKWLAFQIQLQKVSRTDCGVAVIDESFLGWLGWIRNRTLKKITFERMPFSMKKRFFYPDITVFVKADYDLCETRRTLRDIERKRKRRFKRAKYLGLQSLNYLEKDLRSAEDEGFIKVVIYENKGKFDNSILKEIEIMLNTKFA